MMDSRIGLDYIVENKDYTTKLAAGVIFVCLETNLAIYTKTDNVFESPATQLPKRIR